MCEMCDKLKDRVEKIFELCDICGLHKPDELPLTMAALALIGEEAKRVMHEKYKEIFPEHYEVIKTLRNAARSN